MIDVKMFVIWIRFFEELLLEVTEYEFEFHVITEKIYIKSLVENWNFQISHKTN